MPPSHHKEIARFLAEQTKGNPSVHEYRDDNGNRPLPVGCFGGALFSTIGVCDIELDLPPGCFEFVAFGKSKWISNALVTSVYWLKCRTFSQWPLVCEDAVRQNSKNNYRHMAYIPSPFKLLLSNGKNIQWLLGVPVPDSDIGLSAEKILQKAKSIYPEWFFNVAA